MSTLIQACLNGLVATVAGKDIPLDFVLPGDGVVLVTAADWWRDQPGGWEKPEVVYRGRLEPLGGGWKLSLIDSASILFGGDEDPDLRLQKIMDEHRLRTDIQRTEYLQSLFSLSDRTEPGQFDFAPWFAAYASRPVKTAQNVWRKKMTRLRRFGKLHLYDGRGSVVDTLVVDEDGNAATAHGHPWLESLATFWRTHDANRKDPKAYVDWLAGEPAIDDFDLRYPKEILATGLIEDLARA